MGNRYHVKNFRNFTEWWTFRRWCYRGMNNPNVRHNAIISVSPVIAKRTRMNFILSAFMVHVTIESLSKFIFTLATRARKHFALICIRWWITKETSSQMRLISISWIIIAIGEVSCERTEGKTRARVEAESIS